MAKKARTNPDNVVRLCQELKVGGVVQQLHTPVAIVTTPGTIDGAEMLRECTPERFAELVEQGAVKGGGFPLPEEQPKESE